MARRLAVRITTMLRTEFHRDLSALEDELLTLGGMVEKAIAKSLDALKNRDLAISPKKSSAKTT